MKETDDVCIGAGIRSRTSSIHFPLTSRYQLQFYVLQVVGKGAVKVKLQAARYHWKYPMNVEQRLSLIWPEAWVALRRFDISILTW